MSEFPSSGRVIIKCQQCGREFIDFSSKNRRFCSYECAYVTGNRKSSRTWTSEQDDLLRKLYTEVSNGTTEVPKKIAKRIGKTVTAIHVRANRLGLSGSQVGRQRPTESIDKMMETRFTRYGSRALPIRRGSWKAGWRTIGDRKIFARSIWEANYARYLEFLKVRGEIRQWEHEPKVFWFKKIKRGCRSFLPDFGVTQLNGVCEYHEVKGWMDNRSATKIRRFFKYYPKEILIIRDKAWFATNNPKLRSLIPDWEHAKGLPITYA